MDLTALFKMTYGLYVVSAEADGQKAGCIINTAMQVTSEPNRIIITVNKTNYTRHGAGDRPLHPVRPVGAGGVLHLPALRLPVRPGCGQV